MRYLAILCIILTTVMSFTVAANRKCDRPLASAGSCECKPKSAGLLNLADGKLRVCDGTEWKIVQFTIPLGSSSDNPGDSCKHILDNDKQAADGVYWITLTCKFVSADYMFVIYQKRESVSSGYQKHREES